MSNHDELMCNFFAQADALATGKTPVELRAENVPDSLIPHKTFTGNRPSTSVLLPELTAYTVGQILSLYENRIAVQVYPLSVCLFVFKPCLIVHPLLHSLDPFFRHLVCYTLVCEMRMADGESMLVPPCCSSNIPSLANLMLQAVV